MKLSVFVRQVVSLIGEENVKDFDVIVYWKGWRQMLPLQVLLSDLERDASWNEDVASFSLIYGDGLLMIWMESYYEEDDEEESE